MSLTESFMIKYLQRFNEIPFQINLANEGKIVIGEGTPQFEVNILEEIDKVSLLKSTSLSLAEAYINKKLDIKGDLYQVLNLFLSQMSLFSTDRKALKSLLNTSSSKKNQKTEVQSHYDIGNDFYKLWLDDTLSYSCAYFANDTDDITTAQKNKVNHILKKLNLQQGMSLLDVGCGWGYLLIEACKQYGIHGVGITLSKEQKEEFERRIVAENLQDYLQVRLMDYRELEKSKLYFDRIVSVGMLEHVGRDHYELFIQNINAVLKPKGVFLLHYISALKEFSGDPFIKKYVFPGGMIPSLREIIQICGDYNFYTTDVESLRRHYTKTLLCWRDRFNEHRDSILQMYDENFTRMWELYLCSCAAGFSNGIIDLHQIQLTKGVNNELPMTRKYLYE